MCPLPPSHPIWCHVPPPLSPLPPSHPQESASLHLKQRELQSALSAAQRDARAAAGQQERISALEAEVAQAHASAMAAHEQLALAASRSGVLEKAYAAAVEESQALQGKQRELQAALAASQKEARAAAGLQERLSGLAAELEASQKEAAAASEQLTLAHSRTAVLEKAYASAVEVRGGLLGATWCGATIVWCGVSVSGCATPDAVAVCLQHQGPEPHLTNHCRPAPPPPPPSPPSAGDARPADQAAPAAGGAGRSPAGGSHCGRPAGSPGHTAGEFKVPFQIGLACVLTLQLVRSHGWRAASSTAVLLFKCHSPLHQHTHNLPPALCRRSCGRRSRLPMLPLSRCRWPRAAPRWWRRRTRLLWR